MPIYSPIGPISYENFEFDNFLRKKGAPALLDENFSVKEARMGGEMIYEPGNVFPRSISRDNLAQECFLMTLPSGIQPVQFATGYCSELNDYIFAVDWDGTNYYLYRLNTRNLMAPFKDGYSVNIPSGVNGVRGVAVTDTRVAVGLYYNTTYNKNRLTIYDFALNKIKDLDSPFPYDDAFGIDKRFTFDGTYLCVFKSPSNPRTLVINQEQSNSSVNLGCGDAVYQTFTTLNRSLNITRVEIYATSLLSSGNYIKLRITNSDGSQTLWESDWFFISNIATWYGVDLNLQTNPSTVYRLYTIVYPYGSSPTMAVYYTNYDSYSGGSFSVNPNGDQKFRVYFNFPEKNLNRIERYKIDETKSYYEYIDYIPCSLSTNPTDLMAFDGKFYYGYNSSSKKIIKFVINPDNTITLADEIGILEDVRGMLNFNNFIFICYTFGTGSVAVPVSI
jgi:hypothetical protein